MWFSNKAAALLLGLSQLVSASPAPFNTGPHVEMLKPILERQVITPGGKPCGQNNATNRMCWKNNWNISTDYDTTNPPAFNVRTVGRPGLVLGPSTLCI